MYVDDDPDICEVVQTTLFLLADIRTSPLIGATPIIFMTAKVMPSEVAHFLGLGAIGVVGKPFDPLRLGDELNAVWTKARTPSAVATGREGPADVPALRGADES